MSTSVFWRVVFKDLNFSCPVMIGAVLCGLLAFPMAKFGVVGAYTAMILMICAGAAPAVFVCAFLVMAERKERAQLFSLSLPLSGSQRAAAKILAASIAFMVPWAVLAAGTIAVLSTQPGLAAVLPLGSMLWIFMLDQFCLMLAVTMTSSSEGLATATIVFCNVSISIYIFAAQQIPAVAAHIHGSTAVWSPIVIEILAAQALAAVLIVGYTFLALSGKKDFI